MNEKKSGVKDLNKKMSQKHIIKKPIGKKGLREEKNVSVNKSLNVSKNDNKLRNINKKSSKSLISTKNFKQNVSARVFSSVRVIHLGGLNEIGKNMVCFETFKDIIVVDCGMGFPDVDMLGVDLVLPDYSYIEKNVDKLRAVIITHGHEDHIGGIPFFLKRFNVPVYGTRLTIGLIEEKLKEHGILKSCKLNVCVARKLYKICGSFSFEMINVNHSIPDAVGLIINTPAGVIVHTGDFKIDFCPISGPVIDLARFSEVGSKGVLLLMADSTNAEKKGHTIPERQIGETFQKLFSEAANRRIIVASFSSNIHRIQQIVDNAVKFKRHVVISGRSMENVVAKAIELSYLKVPAGVIVPIESIAKFPKEKIIIITTGSQGEPMSALSRMANATHKNVAITSEDFIIISASPIPGNEKFVTRVINELMKLGAKVIYDKMYDVHTSGHACQNELKTVLLLVKPKYYMPVHGEYKHLKANAELAVSLGMPEQNVIIKETGNVVEIGSRGLQFKENVVSGCVFVDGLGVGDVGAVVLRDRKALSQDGIIVVSFVFDVNSKEFIGGPEIITRGFIYVKSSEQFLSDIKNMAKKIFKKQLEKNVSDFTVFKNKIKDGLLSFIFKKTRRSPMILPIIMEV